LADAREDISIDALPRELVSNESASSLRRWWASRQRPAHKPLQPASRARKKGRSRPRGRAARGWCRALGRQDCPEPAS